jgi:hypothetical protein
MTPATESLRNYALRFVRNALSRPLLSSEVDDELCLTIFNALARYREVRNPQRDKWGNWDWPHAVASDCEQPLTPWLDVALLGRFDTLSAAPPRWPDGKKFALCLTHDVDSVSRRRTSPGALAESARRLVGDGKLGERLSGLGRTAAKYALQIPCTWGGGDALWHYEDWLKIEAEHGFRSTFFVFPERLAKPHAWDANYRASDPVVFDGVKMRVEGMFREIADRGWEIGLHGSYHSATDARILKDERVQIETVVGREVDSVRQHYLHYSAATTPAVHATAGLRADSTQGFNLGVGFRAGTALPYWCWDWSSNDSTNVLEIPLHAMDGSLLGAHGLDLSREQAEGGVVQLMDQVEAVGGCLTLNWHPEYLNLPDHWSVYGTVLAEARRRNAWGCSVRDIYDWWTTRDRELANE